MRRDGAVTYLTRTRKAGRRRDPERLLPRPIGWMVLAAAGIAAFIPVAYLVLVSLTPESAVNTGQLFPSALRWVHYLQIWRTVNLARGFLNSLLICGGAALLAVFVASFAAYPLARYTFVGRRSFLYSIIGVQVVPGAMILLPLFVVYSSIQVATGLVVIGSYWGIIITYLTFALPFSLWLMVAYIRTVPRDLEEAALVDGTGPFGALLRIVLPLSVPGMIVTFVFAFLLGWNDVLFASVLTTHTTRTLAVDLQAFLFTQNGTALPAYATLMAAGVVSAIPVVVLYLAMQRFLVGGLAAGALK